MAWCEILKRKQSIVLVGLYFILSVIVPITDCIAVMSIDLGSEWIKVAIVKPGVPMEIAMNKESKRKTSTVVAFDQVERSFSDPAMTVGVKKPKNAYVYLTHIIGKNFDGPALQLYKKRFPYYNLIKDEKRGTPVFQTDSGDHYSPEELLGMVLNNSRHIAEDFADHPMKDAVITVPVYFNQAERKAVLNAAKLVGLNVLQLMNDNTAVALHYGIFRMATFNATEKYVMFFDMGATKTVVTIVGYRTVKVKDRGYAETVPQLSVKGVGFDETLGGLEVDMRLRNFLAQQFKKQGKAQGDIEKNPRAMAKLLKEAKRVKQVLSANARHYAQVENLFEGQDFKAEVSREDLEELCKDLFERVSNPVLSALKSSGVPLDDIDTVILMGGSTRTPKVQEILLQTVKKGELGKSINTDEAGALGSVYKATELTKGFKVKRFLVKDVNLFPIDVSFTRQSTNDQGEAYTKVVTRTLFHHLNPIPQKKVMTFNKKPEDFSFNVSYGEPTFLEHGIGSLELSTLAKISLKGVGDSFVKNKESTPKGVKAYFNLDESGLLHLEKVESHFETVVGKEPKEEEQSTFAKIGSTLSSLFGSKSESNEKEPEKPEEKYEEAKGEDEKKEDESKASKKPGKEEEKKSSTEGGQGKEKDSDNTTEPKPKSKEGKEGDKMATKNATDVKNATSANATVAEKVIPKPILLKEDVTATWQGFDTPELSGELFEASEKLLKDFQRRDEEKRENEKARNALESFVFEFRESMYNENVEKLSSEAEKETISESLSKTSEWLDDEGWDATAEVFRAKLKELKTLTQDLRFRISELEMRPKAISELLNSLNLSTVFLQQVKLMPMADEIYTEKDLKDLGKVFNETRDWLMVNWKKQNESDPKLKPVMLVKDIVNTQGKVDRELLYLINKAKYFVPKPKPKPKANETQTNTTNINDTQSTNTTTKSKAEKAEKKPENAKQEKTAEEKAETTKTTGDKKKAGKGDEETLQLESNIPETKPVEKPSKDKKDTQEHKSDKKETEKSENKKESNEEKKHEGKAVDEL